MSEFDLDDDLLSGFLDEAGECLSTLNEHLLQIEQSAHGGAEIDKEVVDAMFRSAHSLKGSAAFLNLDHMTQVTHLAESLLDEVRQGQRNFNEQLFEILFQTCDGLQSMLAEIGNGSGVFSQNDALLTALQQALDSQDCRYEESQGTSSDHAHGLDESQNHGLGLTLHEHSHLGPLPRWTHTAFNETAICDAMFAS